MHQYKNYSSPEFLYKCVASTIALNYPLSLIIHANGSIEENKPKNIQNELFKKRHLQELERNKCIKTEPNNVIPSMRRSSLPKQNGAKR